MKKLVLFSFLFAIISQTAFAGGPWPQPKGKGYFKLSEWWTIFDGHYTDQGLIDPNATTGIFNTSIYGEFGFSNRLTGIVNAPLLSRNYMNNLRSATTSEIIVAGEALNSIGDIDIGLKLGLNGNDAKIRHALTLTLGLPTGNPSGGTQGNLQTGDGEFNQLLTYDVGTGFKLGKIDAYTSAYAGYNNRTNEFSEEIRYGLELGLGFASKKLWLVGKLTGIESLKNGATAETATSTSLFANNAEFTSVGVEVSYYITKKFGISAGTAGAIRGEIIAADPSYTVGVFLDLAK